MLDFFKSIIDRDTSPIVICDTEHKIIYMNPSASRRYMKYGGSALVGQSLLNCHNARSGELIKGVLRHFSENKDSNSVHIYFDEKDNKDVYMVALRNERGELIGYYEKHEYRNRDMTPFYTFDREP